MPQVLITGAASFIGSIAEVTFATGVKRLAAWLADATAIDRVDEATAELARRGLAA
jgi:dTDP-L-rhamnose 4-epimerase